jgi:hypothetical protein
MLRSVLDPEFTSTLDSWLRKQSELLVMFCYPYVGGRRDYEIHSSLETIARRLSEVPPQTWVIAFRKPQLPIRGVVTPALIHAALASIPDGAEFLLVETALTTYGKASWYHDASGESHVELREKLESSAGRPVMVGEYPQWLDEHGPDVVSGYVPDKEGHIKPGAY